jgi:VanZ family protein
MNKLILVIIFLFNSFFLIGQSFFTPSDTLNKARFRKALAFSATTYTAFSIGLYNIWYKKYDQEPFHFFNDTGEWEYMDKIGHFHTAYLQGVLCYKGASWTGLNKKNSIMSGMICGMLFQSTIEVMDGFSSKWGFSIPDMAANVAGVGVFGLQQQIWNDQRISIKVSSIPINHSPLPIFSTDGTRQSSLESRAKNLYGTNYFERFLKDYNAQAYWLSFNVHSFFQPGNRWPKWLNVAVGYGAENMYGGYSNTWEENGSLFTADPIKNKRYRQVFLGFDIDLPKTNPKNPFLKSVFSVFNVFKIPSPALEINTEGKVVFHLLR